MSAPLRKIIFCAICLLTFAVHNLPIASAQIDLNGDFESGLDGWFGFGAAALEISDDAYEGDNACRLSNRTFFWEGAGNNLTGKLEGEVDYHVQAWIKLPPGQSGRMRVMIYQNDEEGENAFPIGEADIAPDEWTLIQGAFTYDPHGAVESLYMNFDTSFFDGGTFDYLIDSVSITKNEWRADANQRIEQIRKQDAAINFVRSSGVLAGGIEVEAVQVTQAFPFGSALNSQFLNNPVYADFFKTHFDWATTEWRAQWYATEAEQGIEDYVDPNTALAFCEENGISLKGHALFWGDESTRPLWLTDLSNSALETAMETRVSSAVTEFGSRFYGWDVNNEMLDNEFFKDRLGDSIRPWMFTRARELNPDIKLFLNEYGMAESESKAIRYRALADSLIAAGADIGGVGYQSHFIGRVSPKGMEIGLKPFESSGLGIWFTEFDITNPDPERRADALEDFYRYAFSRPEAEGIIMWGFWAGRHWRGPDAAIVDLDWTVNAAGERYFALMDEWTTEVEGSTDATGQFEFRGFRGTYLVTTTDTFGVVNHHLIPLLKEGGTAQFNATASPFNESLTLHGTEDDDVFELDLSIPGQVVFNGKQISLDFDITPNRILFESHGGDDRLVITTRENAKSYMVNGIRVFDRATEDEIRFGDIANIEIHSANPDDRIIFLDTAGDDVLETFPDVSIFTTDLQKISVHEFEEITAFSSRGSDQLLMFDSPEADVIWTNLNVVRIDDGQNFRRFTGFDTVEMASSAGADVVTLRIPNGEKEIELGPDFVDVTFEETEPKQFLFLDVPSMTFLGSQGNSDRVQVTGNDSNDTLRIIPTGTLYFGDGFSSLFNGFFRGFESSEDSTGLGRLIFRDSSGNETLAVNGNDIEISGASGSHSLKNVGLSTLFSEAGGEDNATLVNPSSSVRLQGNWNTSTPPQDNF